MGELDLQESYAKLDAENARSEFVSAVKAGAAIYTATFVGHEIIGKVMPECELRDRLAGAVLSVGSLAAGATLLAGSITAARWRMDEISRLRAINQRPA